MSLPFDKEKLIADLHALNESLRKNIDLFSKKIEGVEDPLTVDDYNAAIKSNSDLISFLANHSTQTVATNVAVPELEVEPDSVPEARSELPIEGKLESVASSTERAAEATGPAAQQVDSVAIDSPTAVVSEAKPEVPMEDSAEQLAPSTEPAVEAILPGDPVMVEVPIAKVSDPIQNLKATTNSPVKMNNNSASNNGPSSGGKKNRNNKGKK